jgi:hypothetical protein
VIINLGFPASSGLSASAVALTPRGPMTQRNLRRVDFII